MGEIVNPFYTPGIASQKYQAGHCLILRKGSSLAVGNNWLWILLERSLSSSWEFNKENSHPRQSCPEILWESVASSLPELEKGSMEEHRPGGAGIIPHSALQKASGKPWEPLAPPGLSMDKQAPGRQSRWWEPGSRRGISRR